MPRPARRSGTPHRRAPPRTPAALPSVVPGLVLAVQAVDDHAHHRLDIETDDVAAEVTRPSALGATQVWSWQGCHSLRAPGGHLLSVIPVRSDPVSLTGLAHLWP